MRLVGLLVVTLLPRKKLIGLFVLQYFTAQEKANWIARVTLLRGRNIAGLLVILSSTTWEKKRWLNCSCYSTAQKKAGRIARDILLLRRKLVGLVLFFYSRLCLDFLGRRLNRLPQYL